MENNINETTNINNEIKEINYKMNKKEDDIKNILNEKDNIIKEMNMKLLEQENKIIENKNEILNLYKKIDEIINKFNNQLKERDNKIIKIENVCLDLQKDIIKVNDNNKKEICNINNNIIKEKENICKEIDNKYNELKIMANNINDSFRLKLNEQFRRIIIYPEYIKKLNYKFIKEPQNLEYSLDITKENTKYGYNDIFEIYISFNDNKEYLASANKNNHNIEIFSLDNTIIYPLKGHENDIRTIRYFINKKDYSFDEYLISADDSKIVLVWDILNNYNIKCKIETNYGYGKCIFSCLLAFPYNSSEDYIITSSFSNKSNKEKDKSGTKIFSLYDGRFIKNITNSNNYNIYYLLLWYNKTKSQYYIIQFSSKKIVINNLLEDELYAELKQEPESEHKCGFIYNKDFTEYLCSSSDNGYINFWDLEKKIIFKIIHTKDCSLCYITKWNNKYIIAADYTNKSFKIIDIENEVIVNKAGQHTKNVICVKKINHPLYGESLLTASNDETIKLWK